MNAIEKANRETVLNWAAYVHDLNYEFDSKKEIVTPEEVERMLLRIAKSVKRTKILLTVYTTADMYRRYYAGHEGRRLLLNELNDRANEIFKSTLK